jgi:hypothetical protein
MSYIEYDSTNPDQFERFIPESHKKRNRILKVLAIVGLICLVAYITNQESKTPEEEDIIVS